MIDTPFLPGDGKLSETDALVIRRYAPVRVNGEAVFPQKGGYAGEEKTVLKHAAGQYHGIFPGIQCQTLIQCHAAQRRHEPDRNPGGAQAVLKVFQNPADHRPGVEDSYSVFLVRGKRIRQSGQRISCCIRRFRGERAPLPERRPLLRSRLRPGQV